MLEIPGYSCTLNTCSITGRSLLRPRSLCVLSWVVSLCSPCWLSAPDVAKTILELLVLSPASQDPSLVIYMLCIFPDQRHICLCLLQCRSICNTWCSWVFCVYVHSSSVVSGLGLICKTFFYQVCFLWGLHRLHWGLLSLVLISPQDIGTFEKALTCFKHV